MQSLRPAPTPTGFAEFVGDNFPVLHAPLFRNQSLHNYHAIKFPRPDGEMSRGEIALDSSPVTVRNRGSLFPNDLRSSLHRNRNGRRRDAISDDNKLARARFLGCWHIEMSRYETVECDGHAAVVVGSAIEHVSSCVVGDAHERIVRCRLLIVPVSSPLRHAVETMTGDNVRSPGANRSRGRLDPWCPRRIVGSGGIVNRDEEEVGEKNLAGWKD